MLYNNVVKRKHITQNRDIIKTNALAQLRIKELEEKVLQLEGERAEKNLEMIRIRANMDRVERATKSVMRGWQLVGAGLAAMAAIDGLQVAEPSDRAEMEAKEILRVDSSQGKQSTRIILDSHALPGGVARSVSRAPEMQLTNLAEENSQELKDDDSEAGIETVEADDTDMLVEDTTQDVRQYNERTVVMDRQEEETARRSDGDCWDMDEGATSSFDERQASTSSVPFSSTPLAMGPEPSPSQQNVERHESSRLQRAISTESFSSFADDEEVQLSDDLDEGEHEDLLRSILQDQKEAAMQETKQVKSRRKRGLPLSPDRSDGSRSVSPQVASFSSSEGDYLPSTRSSRRSSARDRKSINYALPKLNTKMRKPDPADLIPAQGGETRRHEDEHSLTEDGNRDSTPKRTLKGGSEVASTGNLREIRKQHQSRMEEEENIKDLSSQNGRNLPLTRRRSSNTPAPRKSSNSREDSRISDGDEEIEESWSNGNSTIPISWKSNGSTGLTSIVSKSAAIGTPLPRNQSGQNIKALKVANRIQKTSINQPSFSTEGRRLDVRPANRPIATSVSLAGGGGKVLTSSVKLNQAKSLTTSVESKRSSLHAAMTWEGQNSKNYPGQS